MFMIIRHMWPCLRCRFISYPQLSPWNFTHQTRYGSRYFILLRCSVNIHSKIRRETEGLLMKDLRLMVESTSHQINFYCSINAENETCLCITSPATGGVLCELHTRPIGRIILLWSALQREILISHSLEVFNKMADLKIGQYRHPILDKKDPLY